MTAIGFRSLSRCPDKRRLSRSWLALFSVALSGRDTFESLVALFPGVLAGREVFELLVVCTDVFLTRDV